MNIKKKMPQFISLLLSFAMAFSNVIPAYAMEITNSDSETVIDGENIGAEESNFEDIKVTYTQSSSFFVTIPKTIALDGWKQSTYSVKVEGDIEAEQCVYVAPVDGISSTEDIDFYMEDQASKNKKANVVATVTQNKLHWNSAEVADGYAQTDNLVNAPDLTAGTWKGIFQIEIKLESHVTHTHNYIETITKEATCTEDGEKTYTCECGDSYTEVIPATDHHYVDGECEYCGEIDPNHTHNYVDGTCTICGKEVDPYETAPTTAYINWDYTLDDINNIITLNYYKGSETNVIVYANYVIGGKTYKTQLASNPSNIYSSKYMFNGYASSNCQNILSIVFSKNINTSNVTNLSCMFQKCSKLRSISNLKYLDISNVTNMNYIFAECPSLTSLDLSGWDTSNVTSMYWMFSNCDQLSQIIGLETFNTSNVTNMGYMFSYCKKLSSLNLSSWDTSKVTNMWAMFQYCETLYSLDLTSFNIHNVDTLQAMFYYSKNLSKVLVSRDKWVVKSGCNTSSMFSGCGTSSVTYK